jgi:hypothetical protein
MWRKDDMKIIDLSTPFDFDYSVPQPPFTEPHRELITINTRARNRPYYTRVKNDLKHTGG